MLLCFVTSTNLGYFYFINYFQITSACLSALLGLSHHSLKHEDEDTLHSFLTDFTQFFKVKSTPVISIVVGDSLHNQLVQNLLVCERETPKIRKTGLTWVTVCLNFCRQKWVLWIGYRPDWKHDANKKERLKQRKYSVRRADSWADGSSSKPITHVSSPHQN